MAWLFARYYGTKGNAGQSRKGVLGTAQSLTPTSQNAGAVGSQFNGVSISAAVDFAPGVNDMFGPSYKIARVWGIPIKVDMSLIILLVVVAISLIRAGAGPLGILLVLLMEVGIFMSIALHELGHSFVAIRKGCRVREITLMFIGGAAQMERIPTRPLDEFLMAIAGPAVSVGLGTLFWLGGARLPLTNDLWPFPLVEHLAIRCNVIQYVGVINIGLALFNLVPAFPMDGGRVLRSILTPKFGRLKATFIAARLGRFMALAFGIVGIYPPINPIYIAIAFFIFVSAGNEYRYVQMQEAARRQGFGSWVPFDTPSRSNGNEDDQVTISPPPYEKGPDRKTEIRPADDDHPFRNIFGQ